MARKSKTIMQPYTLDECIEIVYSYAFFNGDKKYINVSIEENRYISNTVRLTGRLLTMLEYVRDYCHPPNPMYVEMLYNMIARDFRYTDYAWHINFNEAMTLVCRMQKVKDHAKHSA